MKDEGEEAGEGGVPAGPEAGLKPLKGKGEGGRAEQEEASITATFEGSLSKTNGGPQDTSPVRGALQPGGGGLRSCAHQA